ncbi:hypothetical protein BB559_005141 [Furculomyces boomerangus]|uniref:Uncharacterized protein n=1 Tax=Furculomyces boomerangus TaxID=61424 RepID=A0A2T9YAJ5_9FUNG|nr:hypothetical protein BB559_005141 [Furculomyces boomerangus]
MILNENQFAFSAKVYNVKPLVNLLKTINFKQKAVCEIDNEGIVFTVEDSQCVVAKAYLKKSFFSEFNVIEQNNERQESKENSQDFQTMYFGLFVVKLIECLTLFYGPGSTGASGGTVNSSSEDSSLSKGSTTAQFAYDGSGSDFEIMLEDNGVISICRLATFEPEPISDLEFGSSPVIQTSEWLQDAFDEIDSSGDIIMFSISNSSPILKVMSLGLNGSTEIKYLNNDKLLDSFECIEEQESR